LLTKACHVEAHAEVFIAAVTVVAVAATIACAVATAGGCLVVVGAAATEGALWGGTGMLISAAVAAGAETIGVAAAAGAVGVGAVEVAEEAAGDSSSVEGGGAAAADSGAGGGSPGAAESAPEPAAAAPAAEPAAPEPAATPEPAGSGASKPSGGGGEPTGQAVVHLNYSSDPQHATITVRHADQTVHSEQFGGLTMPWVNGVRLLDESEIPSPKESFHVPVELPDDQGALDFIQGRLDDTAAGAYPMYTLGRQSCVSYCAQVLQAGGVSIPRSTKSALDWLMELYNNLPPH
jgi:hypothetical protein